MLQKAAEKVLYPSYVTLRRSSELRGLRELLASQYLSAEQIEERRFRALKELLCYALRYVPFYRRRFASVGFDPTSLCDFTDLRRLPLLTKSDLQDYRNELFSTEYNRSKLVENRTGGSTGSPVVHYLTRECMERRRAATLRHNSWAGARVGCKTAVIWGHQPDLSLLGSIKTRLRNCLIDRHYYFDSASFSEASLLRLAREFKRSKPDVILAYSNSLAYVVDFCRDQRITLPRPQTIITTAEVLTAENRRKIEEFFGTKVFDRYGSRETSVIASECRAHDGLHIRAEDLYIEFVRNGRAAGPGELGEIIVTDLRNYAFPLIRYQIGDVGSPQSGGCNCGITLPRMRMVAGRTTDFLLSPDGRRVSGVALSVLLIAKVPGIRQAQIIQRQLDRLIFKLVVTEQFSDASRNYIARQVAHFFGSAMEFDIKFVDRIPTEASGKYRFSVCELQGVEEKAVVH